MNTYYLNSQERKKLWKAHRQEHDKQKADRIKAVYLLGSQWSVPRVAEALLLSENSIRNYFEAYRTGGLKELLQTEYKNNSSYLSEAQLKRLEKHLSAIVYLRIADIIRYVEKTFGASYSTSGMTEVLHRLNYVYKKPRLKPAKAEAGEQKKFLKKLVKIQEKCEEGDSLYFMDAMHPHYETVVGCGWIKRGEEKRLPMTLTQKVLNINGAINIETLRGVFCYEETVLKKEHTADLLLALRKQQPEGKIYLISDRSGCYCCEDVKTFAAGLGIEMVYLPPYSPNLNVIERLWLFFKKKVLYNRHYESFEKFCGASKRFFQRLPNYESELRTLLTYNFQITGS